MWAIEGLISIYTISALYLGWLLCCLSLHHMSQPQIVVQCKCTGHIKWHYYCMLIALCSLLLGKQNQNIFTWHHSFMRSLLQPWQLFKYLLYLVMKALCRRGMIAYRILINALLSIVPHYQVTPLFCYIAHHKSRSGQWRLPVGCCDTFSCLHFAMKRLSRNTGLIWLSGATNLRTKTI